MPWTLRSDEQRVPADYWGNRRRPHSPITQRMEDRFRYMMQSAKSSINEASAALKKNLDNMMEKLKSHLGESDGKVLGQLQVLFMPRMT